MDEIKNTLKKNKIDFKENISLKEYTTTKVGGNAKYFVICQTEKELTKAYEVAFKHNIPTLVMGRGSNLLISDEGFNGLVIINEVKVLNLKNGVFYVSSGNILFDFIKVTLDKGFTGLEKIYGIPGTVGGGIYGNAGAYGSLVSDNILRVKVFDGEKTYWMDNKECYFGYRESIFKKKRKLILGAEFVLEKGDKKQSLIEAGEILEDRLKKYKKGISCPGSFFKNVEISKIKKEILQKIPKEKIVFGKIPAGFLLESVDAKGEIIGAIRVSDAHANFLINEGKGLASDYYKLVMLLQKKVYEKFGIKLEPEVQMIGFENNFEGKKVAVLGFGLEGKDLVNYLLDKKAQITVFDRKNKNDLNIDIENENLKFVLGEDYLSSGLQDFDVIFRSPGVYRYTRKITEAENKGVKVSSAVKLFFDLCPSKIIGVTGTKGKGTTASLIYEILKNDKKDVYLVGNIGKPILEILPKLKETSYVVMELSSFQLMDLHKSPHLSVVLNITEDHLDWHKDKAEYISAKESIVKYQNKNDFSVINSDYLIPKNFSKLTKAKVYFVSRESKVIGCFVDNKEIVIQTKKERISVGKTDNLLLRGEHNWENVCSAVMASYLIGIDINQIRDIIYSFKGLEHRLELVREFKGIKFYNDSFATGPQPTIAAIKSFKEPLTLILGGYDKGLSYESLLNELKEYKNEMKIILIGDLQEKLYSLLSSSLSLDKLYKLDKSPMNKIVKKAIEITSENAIVLLSPAAASFDMFKSYKERGNLFKKSVLELK